MRRASIFAALAFTVAGCASSQGGSAVPPAGAVNAAESANRADSLQAGQTTQCETFRGRFHALVACERANGTLESFADRQVAWRVRYFVRYALMPCGETPTVKESYVFHMVMNDLYSDGDVNETQRAEIRKAMFESQVHC